MAKANHILGLDIGRFSAKAVLASLEDGKVVFEKAETLRLPAGSFDRTAMMARWLKEAGLTGRRCVIGLSGQDTMFQPLFMIPGDPRTFEQAAAMEVLKLKEMATETMAYGFTPCGTAPGDRRALLAVVRPSLLNETVNLTRELRLDLLDIVPAPAALYNAQVAVMPSAGFSRIYAHVGHSLTEIAIGGEGGLMFARSFPLGGQVFTDAIAKVKRLTGPQAENLKVAGECSLEKGEEDVIAALERAATGWVTEFQSAVSVFNSLFVQPADRPREIVLSGGGALLPGFPKYVQSKVNLPVLAAPRLPGRGLCEPAAVWTLAAGLAASGLVPPRSNLSLLPQTIRDEQFFRRQKPYWIAAGVAAALILAVSLLGGFYDYRRMANHLREQRASLERRKQLVLQIEALQSQNAQIRDTVQPVANLVRSIPLTRDLISLVAQAKDPNDWLTLVCDGTSYYSKRPAAALLPQDGPTLDDRRRRQILTSITEAPTNLTAALDRIIIEGYTRKADFSTVQRLIDKLEAADFVKSADLLSDDKLMNPETQEERLQDRLSRRFVIDVKMRVR